MFLHHHSHCWQVMHLATFFHSARDFLQGLLAGHTSGWTMTHDLIWLGHLQKRSSWMLWLPSRLLATPGALASTLAHWAITRRGLAAIVTIFGQPSFHLLQTGEQVFQLLH